jgi:heparanase
VYPVQVWRALVVLIFVACAPPRQVTVRLEADRVIARINPRSPGVALDTSQLVGARWWGPDARVEGGFGQTKVEPFDFAQPRLLALSAALGPTLLRVGGTEADLVFNDLSEAPVAAPPPGYDAVLTAERWKALVGFARRLDAPLIFTLNAGVGPRAGGSWSPTNAEVLLRAVAAPNDPVLAWEFGNEVNGYALVLGTQAITAERYAQDFERLRAAVDALTPTALPVARSER